MYIYNVTIFFLHNMYKVKIFLKKKKLRNIYSKHFNKAPINFLYSSKFAFYLHCKNTNKGFMDLKTK